jgi:hypothetical protein
MIMLMGFTAHVCVCVYLSLATRTSWEYPEYINTWRLDVVLFPSLCRRGCYLIFSAFILHSTRSSSSSSCT